MYLSIGSAVLIWVWMLIHQSWAVSIPFRPPPESVLKGERITAKPAHPETMVGAAVGNPISRSSWTVTVDSAQSSNPGSNAVDGDNTTFWHTAYFPNNAALPHTITIDMQTVQNINGISYLPRQDGSSNGNIGQHRIYTSTDGTTFNMIALGAFLDDNTQKYVNFETVPARYFRILAITEAGNRGQWTSVAEFYAYSSVNGPVTSYSGGKWGPTIDMPLVPVAGAIEANSGNVLTWSSYSPSTFAESNGGQTVTATYIPSTGNVTQRTVTNTDHDMFCPGLSIDSNGRPVVTGGNNAPRTSIYDPLSDTWISGPNMTIGRGYQSSATCSDGRIFTIGGSWSGTEGGKNGEIYNPPTSTWTYLPAAQVGPMLTADTQGVYRADNHAWLFGWKNGYVFQAGPSKAMNWYGTNGTGSQTAAGLRANDGDSMCGIAAMYDATKGAILTAGGSPDYQGTSATGNAHVITIGNPGSQPSVTTIASMAYSRIFANGVILPNGQVFITGGQTIGDPFYDDNPDLTPELWDPTTQRFTQMTSNSIPRTYHSIALLLLDGTVIGGGGGLCATCSTNHFDAQIYTPPYLINSDGSAKSRPVINSVSASSIKIGGTLTVTTNGPVTSMALMRYGSATHTVDTDQRRIPLTLSSAGTNSYRFTVPSDPGVALPGYYMLFALNSAGVPSVAKTVKVTLS